MGLVGLLVLTAAGTGSGVGGDRPPPTAPTPRPAGPAAASKDARSLFESYCLDCHSGDTRRGGFALDRLLDAQGKADRREWEKVWKIVRHEFMPPAHADQPTDRERRAITRWVEREVFKIDEARPDPGRVTIRRLNRMEYYYTVRDLFEVDLDLAQELPPDDTAFGFDNIGDAQTLSPALLETYLTLAEKVVGSVIVGDGPATRRSASARTSSRRRRPTGSPTGPGGRPSSGSSTTASTGSNSSSAWAAGRSTAASTS